MSREYPYSFFPLFFSCQNKVFQKISQVKRYVLSPLLLVRPAWHYHLEVKVLYWPGRGNPPPTRLSQTLIVVNRMYKVGEFILAGLHRFRWKWKGRGNSLKSDILFNVSSFFALSSKNYYPGNLFCLKKISHELFYVISRLFINCFKLNSKPFSMFPPVSYYSVNNYRFTYSWYFKFK